MYPVERLQDAFHDMHAGKVPSLLITVLIFVYNIDTFSRKQTIKPVISW